MISVTPENIDALLEKLYLSKRELMGTGFQDQEPIFVMIAKDEEARRAIEESVMKYFCQKYGFDTSGTKYDIHPLEHASTFRFEKHNITLSVICL